MVTLLLGGIRLHALQYSASPNAVVSSNSELQARQSFDSDTTYCVAPPRVFAFEPAAAVSVHVVQAQDVFLPAHPDGWYCNRPPPSF